MGAPGDFAAAKMERMRERIARLEQLLVLNNIAVPPDEDGIAGYGAARDLAFPELDFSEPAPKDPEPVEARAAVEDFPHIVSSLTGLWGKDGFDQYLGRLIVDERGGRKGFNMDTMEELLLLGRIARQRKALFGMFAEPRRNEDTWQSVPEVMRRADASA
ncbi:MAG: hypothetical protein GC151_01210 [Betaproteobacteria bacterium]|nr:hypothetical protein [Betaproteobacteria bacterium]